MNATRQRSQFMQAGAYITGAVCVTCRMLRSAMYVYDEQDESQYYTHQEVFMVRQLNPRGCSTSIMR